MEWYAGVLQLPKHSPSSMSHSQASQNHSCWLSAWLSNPLSSLDKSRCSQNGGTLEGAQL